MLALLLLRANEVVSSDRLMDDVWGGEPPASATTTLRGYISHLRKALRDAPLTIESRKPGYVAVVDPWAIDICRFDHLVEEGYASLRAGNATAANRHLSEALSLWRGPALADFVYESFAGAAVTRLEEQRLVALEGRIEAQLALGRTSELVPELEALVAEHPLREGYRAQLMRALHGAGRRSDALAAYQRGRRLLVEELGIEPSPDLQRLEQAILLHDIGTDEPRQERRVAGNLPISLTSFVGREDELEELASLCGRHRLVSITGTGGSGKTRLALELGARLSPDVDGGVWLIELASVGASDDLAALVAARLGLPLAGDRLPLEAVVESLRATQAVLIFDNCEHVRADASILVHTLLQRCAHLRVLATTREPLGVPGELRWRIPSLEVPSPGTATSVVTALACDGVRLFTERATNAAPEFEVAPTNVESVSRICERLDGMPLGIELAAARLETLALDQILDGLDDRFRLLQSETDVILPRHRTLRAVVDFSYDLLTPTERTFFVRCSRFAREFDINLLEKVCTGGEVARSEVLALLSSLVRKSLVTRVAGDEKTARYRLLETLRSYGLEKATALPDHDELCRRHAEAFYDLAQEGAAAVFGRDCAAALADFDRHHDDHRLAFEWLLSHDVADAAIAYADALWPFWNARFHISEGREAFERCLARPDASLQARATALAGVADLSFWDDDLEAAARAAEEAMAAGDEATRGRASVTRAEVALEQGDNQYAERLATEALWLGERSGFPVVRIEALRVLASAAAARGDLAAAEERAERCRALSEDLGYLDRVATAVGTLGSLAQARGDLPRAAACFEQCLGHFRSLGNTWSVGRALNKLGSVALGRGEAEPAYALAREGLETFDSLRSAEGIVDSLLVMADATRLQGDLEQARLLATSALEKSRERALAAQIAAALRTAGAVALRAGDVAESEKLLSEAVALHEQAPGRDAGEAYLLLGLARARGGGGDGEELCRRSLELFRDVGDTRGVVRALLGLAEATLVLDEPLAALRYLSAARSTGGVAMARAIPHEGADYLDLLREVRNRLGEERFAAAWTGDAPDGANVPQESTALIGQDAKRRHGVSR